MGFSDIFYSGNADVTDLIDVVYDYDNDAMGVSGVVTESWRKNVDAAEYVASGATSTASNVASSAAGAAGDIALGAGAAVLGVAGVSAVAVAGYSAITLGSMYIAYKSGLPQAIYKAAIKGLL